MSTEVPTEPMPSSTDRAAGWAHGLTVFAGVLMIVAGIYHVLAGIAALVRDRVYVSTPEYVYSFDLTGWGWTHVVLGALVAVTGFAVLRGQPWGRAVGILLAGLSLIANFIFIPYYPLWSLLIIALDIAIIWALATYRREPA